jgi:hypothetical protein
LWLRSQGQRTRNPGQEQPQHLHQRPWKLECSTFENYRLLLDPFKELDKCILYLYHIYIYMVIDLKGLVRILNCESRACYVGNPRESFFFSSSRK